MAYTDIKSVDITYTNITDTPEELLVILFQSIDNLPLFFSISKLNQKFNRISQDKYVQHHLKLKYSNLKRNKTHYYCYYYYYYVLPNKGEYYESLNYKINTYKSILKKKYSLPKLAENGRTREIYLLINIDKNLNINIKDECGNTALNYASYYGYKKIVKLLLEYKDIDINIKDKYGRVALHFASYKGYEKIVKSLLEHKNINIKDKYDYTALHFASWNGNEKIVKLLLEYEDIDIYIKNNKGQTALDIALINKNKNNDNYKNIIELLENHNK